jgi:cytidylate kinase
MVKGTIRGAYKRGNVVIVGRGGQAILQERPDVLHVRIEAPLHDRVRRVQELEDLSPDDARDRIVTRDRAAAAYLKRFYAIDWSDPVLYHQVINMGKWDIDAAAHLVASAVSYLPQATPSE